ncbi:MAG: hypothetical protein ABIT96_01940 [Ferruginibacter sp.]
MFKKILPNITISYLTESGEYQCALTSPRFKEIVYHELGHSQHYSQAGCHFWTNYRGAIINELTKLNQPELHPYGSGNDPATAPKLATGEMWGNHCEYIYTNRRYGNGGTASLDFTAPMQNTNYNNDAATGLNAYLNALEILTCASASLLPNKSLFLCLNILSE